MKSHGDKRTLIIGYGNPHRCDDGVGWYVITQLKSKLGGDKGIKTLTFHQLGIGLADEIKNWDQMIFVDATQERLKNGWKLTRVVPEERRLDFSHYLTPSSLLRLVEALYQIKPTGWVISIRGYNFNFGSSLTSKVQQTADRVVEEILRLAELRRLGECSSS